ncbi:unnamed protein product [Sphenostylis stenocarpa]|uniref:Uncharacterized protein n=1 Tax=Sphenostylis stenocarpa TaxID=92480 RepID=A0AA86VH14_9FABA|nr:unnamed protein product [Sphenostylis stenocarpa]
MMKLVLVLFFLASGLRLSVSEFQCDSLECHDYRNLSYGCTEVYVLRIWKSRFDQCPVDGFEIPGACPYTICYIALLRYGAPDEWKPKEVKIYDMDFKSHNSYGSTFSGQSLRWSGLYICHCFFINYPKNTKAF